MKAKKRFEPADDFKAKIEYTFRNGKRMRFVFHPARTLGKADRRHVRLLTIDRGFVNGQLYMTSHPYVVSRSMKDGQKTVDVYYIDKDMLMGWIHDPATSFGYMNAVRMITAK